MDRYSIKDILGYKQLSLVVYLMLYLGIGLFGIFFIIGMCFLFANNYYRLRVVGITFVACSALYLVIFLPMFFIFRNVFLKDFRKAENKKLIKIEGTVVSIEDKKYSVSNSSFQKFGIKVSFEDQIQLLGTLERNIKAYIPINVGLRLRAGDRINLLETEDQEVFIFKDWQAR